MKKILAVIAITASLLAFSIPAASADTVVYNNGNNDGTCTVSAFGGTYLSKVQTLVFQNGNLTLLHCSADLVSGTPVARTQVVKSGNCNLVVTPSGVANMTCTKS